MANRTWNPENSAIDPATIEAYMSTRYIVFNEPPFTLIVGVQNEVLLAKHAEFRVDCSAFITACNPFSRMYSNSQNALLQENLAGDLTSRGLDFIPGIGQHPSGDWPGEPSFLVLGVHLDEAKKLGERWSQNAIVWSGANAEPQLILLR